MTFPLAIYRVAGDSMLPHYHAGDLVLGWRWFRPKAGQVAILRSGQLLIKRLKVVTPNQVWVEGDNLNNSLDSRSLGFLPASLLEAKIIARLSSAKQSIIA